MRSSSGTVARKKLVHEINSIPQEYIQPLLKIVQVYRESIELKPAKESLKQGLKEAFTGEIFPVKELWK